ncbi:MAG: RnfABCDGE type electron transport complex subunit B [Tissierellia bacterium]|nr:RnfABCDGE type electron transport complex subunit B [Tissierellia bacterium]
MDTYIYPVLVLGLLGGLFAVLLQIASKVFEVKLDERVAAVLDALPGANCGACGFPGCEGLANAIVGGDAAVNQCPIGGQAVADNIADIMGVNAGEMVKEVAVVLCNGTCEHAKDKYETREILDCRLMVDLADGQKTCSYGCLGGGTCEKVCDFDAIRIIDGIAVIDEEKCTACKKCISVCPKNLIELVPYSADTIVKCYSNDKAKDVRVNCSVGCTGCGICEKNCPEGAITIDNFLAKIDYDKCTNCGVCVAKCPSASIHSPDMEELRAKEEAEKAAKKKAALEKAKAAKEAKAKAEAEASAKAETEKTEA